MHYLHKIERRLVHDKTIMLVINYTKLNLSLAMTLLVSRDLGNTVLTGNPL
jgi:hypothetical protein